jgi:hypothetical protein
LLPRYSPMEDKGDEDDETKGPSVCVEIDDW